MIINTDYLVYLLGFLLHENFYRTFLRAKVKVYVTRSDILRKDVTFVMSGFYNLGTWLGSKVKVTASCIITHFCISLIQDSF